MIEELSDLPLVIPDSTQERQIMSSVEGFRKGMSDEEVRLLRTMCKNNLFFLVNTVLQYKDLTVSLHGRICHWLDQIKYDQYSLLLIPRFHFKTTCSTIGGSIQLALPDDSEALPYPHNLGPNIRIGITHEAATHAASFQQSIANHVLTNAKLLSLFPEIRPGTAQRKNQSQLDLPRTAFWSEPTFEAFGITTKNQGRHYNVLVPDDIYGEAARDSPTVHKATIKWLDGLLSLTTNIKTDLVRFSGTRYGYEDVYSHIYKIYGPIGLKVFVLSVWEQDERGQFKKDAKGKFVPIFPERISWEAMQPIMADRQNYESNYLNDPAAGSAEFEVGWIQYYDKLPGEMKFEYINNDAKRLQVDLMEMDRIMFVDPATTGLTGVTVTGSTTERQFKVFVLEEKQQVYNTNELLAEIFFLQRKFKVRKVVIEDVLFSALYQDLIQREQIRLNVRDFRIEGLKTKGMEKGDRVRGLIDWYKNHQIFHNRQAPQGDNTLHKSIRQFPGLKDYHNLDSLAMGPRVWRRSAGREIIDKRNKAIDTMRQNVNPRTGYSK